MFEITAEHLEQLCELNEFPVRRDGIVFLGFRGCLPLQPGDHTFRRAQRLEAAEVDHVHPRCTLLQWLPAQGVFAIYPGSTVPHRSAIVKARRAGGRGANQLLTGYFADFRKGIHKAGSRSAHPAFKQTGSRPYRRTADDPDYDLDDPVEIDNPGDNLHAAWCGSVNAEHFASAGCQVVVGYPRCPARGDQPSVGPWREFQERAYAQPQDRFGYVLLSATDAKRIALAGPEGMERVRFGSRGERARRVQEALAARGFYEGEVDSDFGPRSLVALLKFQQVVFGPRGDDGICGPLTAEALGLSWP